jgi:hypothetical protein
MIPLTVWIDSRILDEMYLTNSYDLQSAKTKTCRLETNLVNSFKHAHSSRLSNNYPPTDWDLFGIGESCVVDIESNAVTRAFRSLSSLERIMVTSSLLQVVRNECSTFVVVNNDRSYVAV